MLNCGQARLAMYDLIFNRPICDYPTDGYLRVAVLGEGSVCCEAFKACFSLGQATLPLHITVAGKDAVVFGSKMLDQAGDYPDLKRFAEEEGYAELSFRDMEFSATDAEKCVRELQSESFGYIIIATENKHVSKALAEAIAKRAHTKCLIAVDTPEFTCGITEPNTEVYPYGLETNYTELTRLAKNINFAYATSGNDQRRSREEVDAVFEASQAGEFFADHPVFWGGNYDADSSFACAAHIPAKLSLCKQLSCSERSAESVLSESIVKKNDTYDRLLELEHRRWVAFMAMRGFRAPTPDEEENLLYCYIDGRFNDHRDKKQNIHICMCTSGTDGVVLGQNDLLWEKDPSSFTSKLDQASIRAHRLASKASDVVIKNREQLFSKLNPNDHYHSDFKAAVEKLLNNDCNADALYESAKKTILANRPDAESIVEEIDAKLSVVKCRNRRTDFVSIDAQLINFLPFCLWYRNKYQTVITLTSKIPVRDVVIPTLFCAENALFLGPEIENDITYQSRIRTYFEKRGNNTNAVPDDDIFKYKNCDINNITDILTSLEQYKQALSRGDAILNFVGEQDNKIALAVGMFLQKNNATAMYYDPRQSVVVVAGDPYIAAGLDNKSFSVSEIIELIGGIVKNPLDRFSCESDREKLADIFKEFCCRKTYYEEGNKSVQYNTWVQMNTVFQNEAKAVQTKVYTDEKFNVEKCKKTVTHYCKTIDAKVFHLSDMGEWLESLQENKIIANYTYRTTPQGVEIQFDYCEKEIVEVIEATRARTRLKFTQEQGIKYFFMRLDNLVLTTDKEHFVIRKDKAAYMKALEQAGFIQNMSHRPGISKQSGKKCNYCCNDCKQRDNCANHQVCKAATEIKETNYYYSFDFRDERIHWLLQQQGVPFEEIIYHNARKFAQFDDVQTGVKIAWKKDARNYNDLLNEKLESVQQRYGLCGYYIFKQATIEAKAALKWEENTGTDNEIDVIAVQGMTPIFMSAKTNKKTENGWIYEIKSVADHFGAIPAMIIAHDCDIISNSAFAVRAAQMNVSLLGLETMWDQDRLQEAFASISRGVLVKPRVFKQKELTKDEL